MEQPLGEVARAGGGERVLRDADVVRALRPRTRRGADGVPSARSRSRGTRTRARFPAARPRSAAPLPAATADRAADRRAARGRTSGRRVPLSSRSSVVLPEPFGPRMPTSAPSARRTVTPSTTSGAPAAYRNETLSAHSNADTHVGRPARRRVAQHFFVLAIEQVQRAREDLDAPSPAATIRRG